MQSLASGHKDLRRMVSRLAYRDDVQIRQSLTKNADAYSTAAQAVAPDLRRLNPDDTAASGYVERWVKLATQFQEVVERAGTFASVSMPGLLDSMIEAEAQMTDYLVQHCDQVRWRVCVGRFEREQSAALARLLNNSRVEVIHKAN